MKAIDQVRALYGYNEWANGHVLDAASQLSEEELARELGASFGSVQGNLTHVLGAQNIWLSRWNGSRPPQLSPPEPGQSVESLRQAYEESHHGLRAFVGSMTEGQLDQVLAYTDTQGNAQQRVLWQTLLQVVNHGTHHRAETALLLTSLGKPPRQLDYVFYELERAGGPPRVT